MARANELIHQLAGEGVLGTGIQQRFTGMSASAVIEGTSPPSGSNTAIKTNRRLRGTLAAVRIDRNGTEPDWPRTESRRSRN